MTEDMALRGISIDWSEVSEDSYLHEIAAICSLERLEFRRRVAFFVGENGSGKSTLLEAIAVAGGFNAEGGTRNYAFSTYDSHSELSRALRLIRGPKRAAWASPSARSRARSSAWRAPRWAASSCSGWCGCSA